MAAQHCHRYLYLQKTLLNELRKKFLEQPHKARPLFISGNNYNIHHFKLCRMYKLETETAEKRTYRSTITDTVIGTHLLHTGEDGKQWWAFDDLLQIPFIRKKAGEKVTQLYGTGLTKEDLNNFVAKTKAVLKSDDAERYEKAYSELLQLEAIVNETADPVKQSLSLCAVYILADDEQVDAFSFAAAIEKMNIWALQPDLQAFFLNWLTDGMDNFTAHYSSIMQIASTLQK
jgi:hypothetical protein